jgi:hypothetical protein
MNLLLIVALMAVSFLSPQKKDTEILTGSTTGYIFVTKSPETKYMVLKSIRFEGVQGDWILLDYSLRPSGETTCVATYTGSWPVDDVKPMFERHNGLFWAPLCSGSHQVKEESSDENKSGFDN